MADTQNDDGQADPDDRELTAEQQRELDQAAARDQAEDAAGSVTDSPDERRQSDEGDAEQLGDAGKRALDAMKRDRKAARDELVQVRAKLKEYEDKDKSESERLQEAAESAKSKAHAAETNLRSLQVAMDRAPDHATLAHVRAVAKRVRGDNDDELGADADELFALVAPERVSKPSGKPTERLRPGGTDPEEPVEETDPKKLAALIRRS